MLVTTTDIPPSGPGLEGGFRRLRTASGGTEEGKHVEVKLKLIGSTSPDIFEQRLNDFIASLDKDDIVVDVKFSTSPVGEQVEYNALVHYQATDRWED